MMLVIPNDTTDKKFMTEYSLNRIETTLSEKQRECIRLSFAFILIQIEHFEILGGVANDPERVIPYETKTRNNHRLFSPAV